MVSIIFCLVALASTALAHPLSGTSETVARRLPSAQWYHHESHPAHELFRRQAVSTLPAVGTPEWTARFPQPGKTPTQSPAAWITALNNAVNAGLIPANVPVAATGPRYPGANPGSPAICSATFGCYAKDDVVNAPPGIIALSFDDGPYPPSGVLYDFLLQQKQVATHFMIGTSIIGSPALFTTAFARNGDDIAVHTWSHPYMTTLTNEQVVAELGWTVQIIHDSTGGRVPKFWRPPYGDVDNRVRAIAKNVFGLTTVIWNHDTEDWTLGATPPGTSPEAIQKNLAKWITGPKTPGLIILEHELSKGSVQAFIDAYPSMKSNGWNVLSVPDAFNSPWYFNAANDTGPVVASMDPGDDVAGGRPGNFGCGYSAGNYHLCDSVGRVGTFSVSQVREVEFRHAAPRTTRRRPFLPRVFLPHWWSLIGSHKSFFPHSSRRISHLHGSFYPTDFIFLFLASLLGYYRTLSNHLMDFLRVLPT